jgi:hypothetical protein
METPTQETPSPKPRLELPPELASLDMMLRSGLEAKNAPKHIFDKWDDFLVAVAEWTASEKGGENVSR